MSPGNTMLRVYGTLKARILAGEFLPGERLDPGRLALGLGASRTPVRDALIRLSGERIVDSWEQEGFRAPHIGEAAIRDLYEWTNEVMHVVLRAASRRPTGERPSEGSLLCDDYVTEVATCFLELARRSPNHEHRAVVQSLNDRSATIRMAERSIIDDVRSDIAAVETAFGGRDWTEVGRAIDHFHRRRLRLIGEIAAALRSREPQ